MYTHSQTQTHSFSHLLTGLFVPHLSGGVKLGCSGQGWHPSDSFTPTNAHIHTPIRIHTTKTQRAWHLSDLSPRDWANTAASVLSCPVLLDLQTGLGQTHKHTACINMMDNAWHYTGHFNYVQNCWLYSISNRLALKVVFRCLWWSSPAMGNYDILLAMGNIKDQDWTNPNKVSSLLKPVKLIITLGSKRVQC